MRYIIVITPDDKIKLEPYEDYRSINKCVGGFFELCGHLPTADGGMFDIYCYEEYLLHDEYKFNAFATFLLSRFIYGNIAILISGWNEDHELDSLPLDEERAVAVVSKLEMFRENFAATLSLLHEWYDDAPKPEPSFQFVAMTEDELAKTFGVDKNEDSN